MKLESKFYNELKRITPKIRWTRIENTSVFGCPDLLGYNTFGHYFTVELKVSRSNKVRLSPHQIAYHFTHPKNSFIMVKSLAACTVKLYEGQQIKELAACGLALEPCCLGLAACVYHFDQLGAWSLRLAASFLIFCNNLDDTRRRSLVFTVNYPGYVSVPTLPAAAALATLRRCRTGR